MQYLKQGERAQLRFLSRAVEAPLLEWLGREGIGYAALTGLGAVNRATARLTQPADKAIRKASSFTVQMEVVSLIGNVTIREGVPFIHAHVGLGRSDLSVDWRAHERSLAVHPTLEGLAAARN